MLTEDQKLVYWCSFNHFGVIKVDGRYYLIEEFQEGEVLDDDDYWWGTIILDLTERRFQWISYFVDTDEEVKNIICKPEDGECRWEEYDTDEEVSSIFNMANLNYFRDKYTKKEQD